MIITKTVLCDVTPYSLVDKYRHVGEKMLRVAPGFIQHSYCFALRPNLCPTFPVSSTFYQMVYSALKEETAPPNCWCWPTNYGVTWRRVLFTVTVARTSNLTRWELLWLSSIYDTLRAKLSPEKLSKTITVSHVQEFKPEVPNSRKQGNFTFMLPCIVTNFFLIKPTDALIPKFILHVSGSFSAHHQEFSTVHSALVYVMQVWLQLSSTTRMFVLESCHQNCMT